MKVFAARWYVGCRIWKFSFFVGWINMRTAKNYRALLDRHDVPL